MGTTDEFKASRELDALRWGIVIGGLLGNSGFANAFFERIRVNDAPNDTLAGLLGAIERQEPDRVRKVVARISGHDAIDGESSLCCVLRRIHGDVVSRALKRVKGRIGGSAEPDAATWIAEAERAIESLKDRIHS